MRLAATLLALAAGCGQSERAEEAAPRQRRARAAAARDAGPALFDDQGELVPGDVVLGVVLPKALRPSAGSDASGGERASFQTTVPVGKVLRFFQRHLTTGEVEARENGARFMSAMPRPPGDPSRRVNVWVYADDANVTHVSLFDNTNRPGPPPTQRDLAREFARPPNTERRVGRTE